MKHYPLCVIGLLCINLTQAWADEIRSEPQTPPVSYSELSRKVIDLGDHKVSLVRVRPPNLPKAPLPPPPRVPTAEEQATYDRLAEKAYATLNVTATVYLRPGQPPVTELRWADETGERNYRAWCSADFRYLTQLNHLETETTVYMWFPFVDAYDLSEWPADQKSPIPDGLQFSTTEAEYFVDARAKQLKDQETTLAGLDYLVAYYQVHYTELKADYEKREAANAEREQELRENPPKTPDATIRWWPITAKPSNR